jgi:hypothetical protein
MRKIVLIGFIFASGMFILPEQTRAATIHTMDILELPNGGGTQARLDGNIVNTFPGSETISFGANLNDGAFTPQVFNVNLYDDLAHTIVSDRFTITVFAANPDQISLGLTSATPGIPLLPLSPEDLGITETSGLQVIKVMTSSTGTQTTIRLQSLDDADVTPQAPQAVPEPSSLALSVLGSMSLVMLKLRASKRF